MHATDKKSYFKSAHNANTWDLSCMGPHDIDNWSKGDDSAETMSVRWSRMAEPLKSTVLDIGTGFGWGAQCFVQHGFKVSAIDISRDTIEYAKKCVGQYLAKIDFQLGDMLNIPYADNSFDFSFANNILYLNDRAGLVRSLDEIHRVLKPGGEVYFNLLCKSLMIPGIGGFPIDKYSLRMKVQFGKHDSVFTHTDEDDIPKLLNGFKVSHMAYDNHRYYVTAQKTAER